MKAIVFYSATGQGFKSPADAIVKELQKQGVEAKAVDFYAAIGMKRTDMAFKNGWKLCLKHPWIFRFVYALTDSCLVNLAFFWQVPFFLRSFSRWFKENPADFIISVHFVSTFMLARLPAVRNGALPFYGYNSDVVLSHHAYIQPKARMYYVSTELGRQKMIKQGMKPEKVTVCGFPLDEKFKKQFLSVSEERKKLGLKDMFTLAVSFGGEGIGNSSFLYKLFEEKLPIQVIAICGRSEELKNELEQVKAERNLTDLHVLGFTVNIQDYLYCSDISAGKAGLNTVFESIYLRRPFMTLMAMANERHCVRYALDNHYAVYPKNDLERLHFITEAIEGRGEFAIIKESLKELPVEFSIDSMAKDMIRLTEENTKRKLQDSKYILFDLAGTLCDIPIGNTWEEINLLGISNVLNSCGFTKEFGNAAAEQVSKDFVKEKRILRKEAKTSFKEYPIAQQLEAFFQHLALSENPWRDFFIQLLKRFNESLRAELDYQFIKPELDITIPFPEATEVLRRLAEKKPLYVLSNNVSRILVEKILDICGIREYFSEILVSADIGYRKPHQAFWEATLSLCKAKAADCVMIGDRLGQDIQMAKDAGMQSIHVAMVEHEDNEGLEHIEGDIQIHSLTELPALLIQDDSNVRY